jgi:hypothetical protein
MIGRKASPLDATGRSGVRLQAPTATTTPRVSHRRRHLAGWLRLASLQSPVLKILAKPGLKKLTSAV